MNFTTLLTLLGLALEASSLQGGEADAAALIEADGTASSAMLQRQGWYAPPAPPDPRKPQPLAETGTIDPFTCHDTTTDTKMSCFDFSLVKCKPWRPNTPCSCDKDFPVCVTDVARRSSPASPATQENGKVASSTIQYACCAKPEKKADDV
eukprot:TRINITY_DN6466_c0_g1_i1.p1 TRINITY_DN6466_c0_g1~~TRINITY_DN6466_c0_g1_i1.p1  ORF type:complete len:151 (-),score=25.20 TRINITY_DN6466_c0_g1_i1:50-502(-)